MSTVSSDPAHAKKSRNSRKALKQKNEIVESSPLLSPVSGKGKESKSFEKDLMEMQAMLEKMKIEKEKTEDLLKEKDEILRKKEVEQEKLKTELKKLQKMKEFKPNMVRFYRSGSDFGDDFLIRFRDDFNLVNLMRYGAC